jgi:hypothetical protein
MPTTLRRQRRRSKELMGRRMCWGMRTERKLLARGLLVN